MMPPKNNIQDTLPAYTGEASTEIWEPAILVLAGTTIHAESADTAPLYRLSRAVANLTISTKEVEFRRIERSVKTRAEEPVVVPQSRHIYDINCTRGGDGRRTVSVFIECVSRNRTMGHLGIQRLYPFLKKGLVVKSIDIVNGLRTYGTFSKDASTLFLIEPRKDNKDVWTDCNGKVLAMQDWSDDQHKLIITVSLHCETVDALVALWCGRIWQYSERDHAAKCTGMNTGIIPRFQLISSLLMLFR